MLDRVALSVNPRRAILVLSLAASAFIAPAVPACHLVEGELILAYEITSPLVAHLGPALSLRIDRHGCAEVRRFALSAHPGATRLKLDKSELATLRAELSSIPDDFDPRAAKRALRDIDRERSEGFAVLDAPIRRFHLARDGRQPLSFVWPNLEQDLLNHGEEPELRLMAHWRDRLEALARRVEELRP